MPEICHRVGIAAPRHRVYEVFATKDGLAEFWTRVEGDRELGAQGSFRARPSRCERPRAELVADMRVGVTVIAYRAR